MNNATMLGSFVLESCPEHLVILAIQSAKHCLNKPDQIKTGFGAARFMIAAQESLDEAITILLAKEANRHEDSKSRQYLPFDNAVLWGVLAAFAFSHDLADGHTREEVLNEIYSYRPTETVMPTIFRKKLSKNWRSH